ncbi:MAG: TIR domain-containing protein [Longimicrobiales bacterium]
MDEPSDPPSAGPRYDAFISYSRVDRGVAEALERALEAYRPPPGIGPDRRLRIFRDEGDLTGAEYGHAIDAALRASDRLIVLCSPDARASQWVDDEIRRFLSLRGPEQVVPVLVAGIPNNEGEPDDPGHAFPDALMEAMGMPLAPGFRDFSADTDRPDRGRFRNAWFTLLATLLDVSREDIEERERVRRARVLRRVVGGAAVLVASMAGLTAWALASAAGERRARIDAQARLLEVRAENAVRGQPDELRHPVAALLLAREALALAQEASEGQRLPGAESVIQRGLALGTGRGLAGWQEPVPRQARHGAWFESHPEGRWLVSGDFVTDWVRVWDLAADEPGEHGTHLDDTYAAAFLGDWLVGAGQGGLRAWRLGRWDAPAPIPAGRGYASREVLLPVPGRPGAVLAIDVGSGMNLVELEGDSLQVTPLPALDHGATGLAVGRWVVRVGQDLEVVDLDAPDPVLRGAEARAALQADGVVAVELGRRDDGPTSVVVPADPDLRTLDGFVIDGGRAVVVRTSYDAPWMRADPDGQRPLVGALGALTVVGDHGVGIHEAGGLGVWSLTGSDPALVRRWHEAVEAFAVSPDGTWLVTAGPGAVDYVEASWPDTPPPIVRLYRLDASLDRSPPIRLASLPRWPGAHFTSDGRWMVDAGIRAHALVDLAEADGMRGYASPIGAVAWVPGGQALYTAHTDGTVRRWTRGQPGVTRSAQVLQGAELASLAVSPDEDWLVGEPTAGGLALWRRTDTGYQAVPGFDVSPEQYWALDWSDDAAYRGLWDDFGYYDGSDPLVGGGRPGRALPVAFDPSGDALLAARQDGARLRWDLAEPTAPPTLLPPRPGADVPAPGWVVRAVGDSVEVLREGAPDGEARRFAGASAVVDPTGRWVATGCGGDGYPGASPRFGPRGRWLTTWQGVWDLDAARPGSGGTGTEEDPSSCVVHSLSDAAAPPVRLREADAIAWPDIGGGNFVAGSAFGPNGRWLVARYTYRGFGGCGYGTYLHVVDLAASDPATTMAPLPDPGIDGCPDVQFDPSGRWLVTGRLLWDLSTGRRALRPIELPGAILGLHPGGRLAAIEVDAGGESLVRFVTLDIPALLREVCVRAGRNLSFEEWRVAFPGEPYRALCPTMPVPPVR